MICNPCFSELDYIHFWGYVRVFVVKITNIIQEHNINDVANFKKIKNEPQNTFSYNFGLIVNGSLKFHHCDSFNIYSNKEIVPGTYYCLYNNENALFTNYSLSIDFAAYKYNYNQFSSHDFIFENWRLKNIRLAPYQTITLTGIKGVIAKYKISLNIL
ncbi:hypothetical protein HZS_5267 [Henneguya salminicola]|nr:hypothetical protein HZS_5267 [Henneguya salminicola]